MLLKWLRHIHLITEMFKLIKRKPIVVILALLALVLLGLAFLVNRQSGEEEPALQLHLLPSLGTEKHFMGGIFDFASVEKNLKGIKKEMVVYQIEPPLFSPNQALTVAKKLGFEAEPNQIQEQVLTWSSQQNYLSIDLTQATIGYGLDLLINPDLIEGVLETEEELEKSALSLVKNELLPLPREGEFKINSLRYLVLNGPQFVEIEKEQASLVQFDFDFFVDQTLVLNHVLDKVFLRLILGPNGKIVKLDYQLPFESIQKLDVYPLKTRSELVVKLANQPFLTKILSASFSIPNEKDYQQIKSLTIKEMETAYLIPDKSKYLQPVFFFKGDLVNTNNQGLLVLPAVKDLYLSPGL